MPPSEQSNHWLLLKPAMPRNMIFVTDEQGEAQQFQWQYATAKELDKLRLVRGQTKSIELVSLSWGHNPDLDKACFQQVRQEVTRLNFIADDIAKYDYGPLTTGKECKSQLTEAEVVYLLTPLAPDSDAVKTIHLKSNSVDEYKSFAEAVLEAFMEHGDAVGQHIESWNPYKAALDKIFSSDDSEQRRTRLEDLLLHIRRGLQILANPDGEEAKSAKECLAFTSPAPAEETTAPATMPDVACERREGTLLGSVFQRLWRRNI